jgi:hypothetical protein
MLTARSNVCSYLRCLVFSLRHRHRRHRRHRRRLTSPHPTSPHLTSPHLASPRPASPATSFVFFFLSDFRVLPSCPPSSPSSSAPNRHPIASPSPAQATYLLPSTLGPSPRPRPRPRPRPPASFVLHPSSLAPSLVPLWPDGRDGSRGVFYKEANFSTPEENPRDPDVSDYSLERLRGMRR